MHWRDALIAAILMAMTAATAADAARPDLGVGQPFPELALPAIDDGRPLSVADFRGEKLVLHVFASW